MPLMFPWYLACAVLAKTSLLGLGLLTLGLSLLALLVLRLFGGGLPDSTARSLRRSFRTSPYVHLGSYALLGLKLWLIDGWQDVPAFLLGHLVLHHAMSALIASILIVLSIRLYNQRVAAK